MRLDQAEGLRRLLVRDPTRVASVITGKTDPGKVSLLIVVDATTSGITESYALIKRMALDNACMQFEIVVNKVSDEQTAKKIFGNMAEMARRNLAARLEYCGYISKDGRLTRASTLQVSS